MAATFVLSMFSKAHAQNNENESVTPVIDINDADKVDPSLLRKLRAELQSDMMKAQKQAEVDGVVKSTAKNFVPTSAAFAIAGGAIYFTQLMTISNSDPLLMVKHLESLKDPIGHMSFGMFMLSQGIYINYQTKGLDPMTKSLMMRQLMYKGLAVGSFFSGLSADILMTMKTCTGGWIENKNDEASHAACDEALKQWTIRNKTTQYVPQIMSLLVTQVMTDTFELGLQKTKSTKAYNLLANAADKSATKLFKITAANVDILITPGGPAVKVMKWTGQILKFGMFLTVDHMITPSVTRFGKNLLLPVMFESNRLGINSQIIEYQKIKKIDAQFHESVTKVSERLSEWRQHLNAKNEIDLQGWLEATTKLLNQIKYTKDFYAKFIENVFETKYRYNLIKQGHFDAAPDRAWAMQRRFPFRTLPLYGVNLVVASEKMKLNDAYLNTPYDLEASQSENIFKQVTLFKEKLSQADTHENSKMKMQKVLNALLVKDYTKQGQALYKMNSLLSLYRNQTANYANNMKHDDRFYDSPDLTQFEQKFLTEFRKSLGDPRPQLNEAASYGMAFDTHSDYYELGQQAGFDLYNFSQYRFYKASDLMIYNMICGKNFIEIKEELTSGLNVYTPRIIDTKENIDFCNKGNTWTKEITKINSHQFYTKSITVDGVTYPNVMRLIVAKMDKNLVDDVDNKTTMSAGFNKWWSELMIPALDAKLKDFDQRFSVLVDRTYKQVLDNKTFTDWSLDLIAQTKYLGSSIEENLYIDLEFQLRTLEMIINEKSPTTKTYFDDIAKLGLITKNNQTSSLQLKQLRLLHNEYITFLGYLRANNFDYKKFNEAKEVLVNQSEVVFKPMQTLIQAGQNETGTASEKSIAAIYKSLENIQAEATRLIMLKIQLKDKLSADTSLLNKAIKDQKKIKRNSAVGGF